MLRMRSGQRHALREQERADPSFETIAKIKADWCHELRSVEDSQTAGDQAATG